MQPHIDPSRVLQRATAEMLLALAILGPRRLKPRIDRELDRRAVAASALRELEAKPRHRRAAA